MLGDLVEDHASHGDLGLQHLEQMPRDGLTLAVLVRREEEFARTSELLLEFGDRRLLIGVDDVERREALVGVDGVLRPGLLALGLRKFGGLARQVPHMANGRLDAEIAAAAPVEVALDRLRLRR